MTAGRAGAEAVWRLVAGAHHMPRGSSGPTGADRLIARAVARAEWPGASRAGRLSDGGGIFIPPPAPARALTEGEPYAIVDIGMRMLTVRERFNAQGFPPDFIIDVEIDDKPISQEAQGRLVGNSVCPPLARALVAANCADMAVGPSRFAGREAGT